MSSFLPSFLARMGRLNRRVTMSWTWPVIKACFVYWNKPTGCYYCLGNKLHPQTRYPFTWFWG